ncbi:MAG: hypothetical protein WCQ99_12430 [Pseudomonadota bacterium]
MKKSYPMRKDKSTALQTCPPPSHGTPAEKHKKLPRNFALSTFELVPAFTSRLMEDLVMEHARHLLEKKTD